MALNKEAVQSHYLNQIKKQWKQASNTLPDFLVEITSAKKTENEAYIRSTMEKFQKQLSKCPRISIRRKHWKKELQKLINQVLNQETVIGIHRVMDRDTLSSYQSELEEFLCNVRRFSPELGLEEIGQAIRNYIVYLMFKEIHLTKTGFSMAAFGYSMLYPFTDNYIDNKACTEKDKEAYNHMIQQRLEGKPVQPSTVHQQKTCDLLQAIESEYPREQEETVYHLLLMMLDAQKESLRQQQSDLFLSKEQRLDISLYKGGISVLIDRYFVNENLSEEDIFFYLGIGFFLQLADDLQDIHEDIGQGYQTLFTLEPEPLREEMLVNKLIHFITDLMNSYQAKNNDFKDLVLYHCFQLIYLSVAGSSQYFSKEYLTIMERFLPVTQSFYYEFKKTLLTTETSSQQNKYLNLLDALL